MKDCAENSCKRRAETEAMESSMTSSFSKKMKIDFDFCFEELNLPSLNFELQDHRLFTISLDKTNSTSSSSNSVGFLDGGLYSGSSAVSLCSSMEESTVVVKDSLRFVDLEAKSFETESSTCIDNKFRRETTPSSQFRGETDEMESPATEGKTYRKSLPAEKMPSQVEIDQFFEEAEKEEQKRFAEKYNYDIAKDVPLQGRYQWDRLKP